MLFISELLLLSYKLNQRGSISVMDSQYFFTKFIQKDLLIVVYENNHLVFTVKEYELVLKDQPARNNYHQEGKIMQIRQINESDVRENKVCIELTNVSTLTLKYEDIKSTYHKSVFLNCLDLFQMLRDDEHPQIEKYDDVVNVIFQYNAQMRPQGTRYFQVQLQYIPKDEKKQFQQCEVAQGPKNEMKNEEPKQGIKEKKKQSYVMVDEREEGDVKMNEIKTEIKGIKSKINGLANVVKETKINLQNRLNEAIHKTQQRFNAFDQRLNNHLSICLSNKQTHYQSRIAVEKTIKFMKNIYKFSPFFMNANIRLKSQRSIICNSKDNSLKIAMIQPPLIIDPNYKQPYYYKISLKVVKIGAYIGVGIRDNQFAKKISYRQYRDNSVPDESLYILDYNGDVWSNYFVNGVQENPSNAFKFEINDIIEIKFTPDISKVTFKVRNSQKRISLKINPQQHFNFCFCVYLEGEGDEVQIVENIERNLYAVVKKQKQSYLAQIKKEAK